MKVKTISRKDYELFDLRNDLSQENNIFDRHPKKDSPKKLINDQLTKTKNNIYPWKELPLYLHDRKNKTNWFDTNINLVDED